MVGAVATGLPVGARLVGFCGVAAAAAVGALVGGRLATLLTVPVVAAGAWLYLGDTRQLAVLRVDLTGCLGIEPSAYVVVPALLVVALAWRPATTRAAGGSALRPVVRAGWVARGLAAVGLLAVTAYELGPQMYFEEVIDRRQEGDMAVVVDGRLEHHPWDRRLSGGRPAERVLPNIRTEADRLDLARGIGMELGGGGPGVAWTVAKAGAAGWLGGLAAFAASAPVFALGVLVGRNLGVGWAVRGLLYGVGLLDLGLVAFAGLGADAGVSALRAVAWLLLVAGADVVGRHWAGARR